MNTDEMSHAKKGRLGTAVVGISAMLIGFLVQLDVFEWLLNILGWLLVIVGTLLLIGSLGSSTDK